MPCGRRWAGKAQTASKAQPFPRPAFLKSNRVLPSRPKRQRTASPGRDVRIGAATAGLRALRDAEQFGRRASSSRAAWWLAIPVGGSFLPGVIAAAVSVFVLGHTEKLGPIGNLMVWALIY